MSEHTAFLGIGSNVGDREGYLRAAREALSQFVLIERASSIYETEPVDYRHQPWFLNQVVAIRCSMEPYELLTCCQMIEQQLGRVRKLPKGPRTVDLDILLYDDLILDEERRGIRLVIPHPRLHLRKFVLIPLCEIAPSLKHPITGHTIEGLLSTVDDRAQIIRYTTSPG